MHMCSLIKCLSETEQMYYFQDKTKLPNQHCVYFSPYKFKRACVQTGAQVFIFLFNASATMHGSIIRPSNSRENCYCFNESDFMFGFAL